ncbi:MAG: hypothetical protein JNL98_14440 [Bryobacterales bacterium]|nr:hypothetical protein [Bryobacterales bacterium]
MRLLFLSLFLAGSVPAAELFKDDFSRLPNRIFSEPVKQLTNAISEYHYLPHRGVPIDPWANALVHMDVWTGGDEDGKTYVEQHTIHDDGEFYTPVLIAGDPEWSDYTLEVKVRPLLLKDMGGIVFRYHTNRHHYLFALEDGKKAVLRLHLPIDKAFKVANWKELGTAPFPYETKRYYTMKVETDGPKIRCYIDGKLVIEVSDSEILKGKIGISSHIPTRFTDVRVTASDAVARQIQERINKREAELKSLRDANPKPKLWKKFDTTNYGAARNARFGDLDGDGRIDMLIAQNIRKAYRNAFASISCLTAVNFDGKVLWQIGRPDPYNDVLAHDTPFQIQDVDGDGKNEVIMVKDFKIQVLDGKTGKLKQSASMPEAAPTNKIRAYEYEVGDSIFFANVSGKKGRHEILIKDRYANFWVYNNDLQLLWKGKTTTGHFPFSKDIDGDGKEELMVGYSLWTPGGKMLWTRDKEIEEHADAVMIGNYTGDAKAPMLAYAAASDDGLAIFDLKGAILKHIRLGHAQSMTFGKYRPDLPGLQLLVVNFWRTTGIITELDANGNILAQEEPIHSGSPLLPVNWRGDGTEFAMLTASAKEGGLVDGHLRRVVLLPQDGHPEMAFNVLDVTGDPRDELIVWDPNSVWIYTQDRPFTGNKIYAPIRNPHYNESNYRSVESVPNWKDWRGN